jgi:hypothetical protein
MAYTDLFNEAIDDLTASLTAVSGLRVVNDATKIVPNCVFIDAPSFTTIAGNGNVIRLEFPDQGYRVRPSRVCRFCVPILEHRRKRARLTDHRDGWPSVKP